MGKKNSSRRSRNVYDPTIAVTDVDRLEKTNLFAERDPLAMGMSPEMEDIRNQSDIRDARFHNDDKSTRIRWKYIIPVALVGFIAIVTAAAVAGKSNGSNNQNKTSSSPNQSPSQAIKFLPEPPEVVLAQLCDPEKILTADGLKKCQEMCKPSSCCNFPTSVEMSCLFGNEQICQEYHKFCYILSEGAKPMATTPNFPAATAVVYEVCSGESLSTVDGHNKCAAACKPAECCYTTGGTGSCSTEAKCLGYAPCLALRATTHEHAEITRLVNAKCSKDNIKTTEGSLQCESVCAQSVCCFVDDVVCEGVVDFDFCGQYDQCKDIVLKDLNPGGNGIDKIDLDPPPSNLALLCSLDNIKSNIGRAECEDACEAADCCTSGACVDEHADTCSQYERQCANLYFDEPDTVAAPPDDLEDVCNETNVRFASGKLACEEICRDATCCIASGGDACYEGNELYCNRYNKSCKVLDGFGVEGAEGDDEDNKDAVVAPPPDFEDVCDETNVRFASGKIACEEICRDVTCCIASGGDACYEGNELYCNKYIKYCKVLDGFEVDAAEGDYEDNDDVPFSDQKLNMPPTNIDYICSMNNVESTLGLEQCQYLCEKAVCCQADLWGEDACYDNNVAACDAYKAACQNLDRIDDEDDSYHINPPPSSIGTICSAVNVQTEKGLYECQQVCSLADCCQLEIWDSMYCREDNEDTCSQFDSHCSILDSYEEKLNGNGGDAPYLAEPPPDLSLVCSQTNVASAIGRSNCDAICAQAACCEINFRNAGSCIENNQETCQLYHSHCWKLNPEPAPPTSETVTTKISPAPSTIKDVCSFESLQTQAGHNSCWDICEPASCCWRKDVASCASESVCSGYYMCFGLGGINYDKITEIEWEDGPEDGPVGGSGIGNNNEEGFERVTQEEVQEACSRIILTECETLCEPASCCAVGTGTCTGASASIDCDVYRACDVLY